MKRDIDRVINNDYCVGCGACQAKKHVPAIENSFGMYIPDINNIDELDGKVCPFSGESPNELQLATEIYSNLKVNNYSNFIGHYSDLFAGFVKSGNFRHNGTSGGMTKWLLSKILETGQVDGIIHVVREKNPNCLFKYDISYNIQEIQAASQSAYYTVNFSEVLNKVINDDSKKTYAFVGIPCYCKAIRAMSKQYPTLKNKIKFVFGILCGHMKTKNYAKLMAWEAKLDPNKLEYVNFRKKSEKGKSSEYLFHGIDHKSESIVNRNDLLGGNYNIPHLKYKSCDFCEDVFAYCADIVFGDAWLPKYIDDPKGTNIVIVRNPIVGKILDNFKYELHLERLTEDEIIRSQSSSFSHRIEEIGYRIYLNRKNNLWTPPKMSEIKKNLDTPKREKIQKLRTQIREKSHHLFKEAIDRGDINYYVKNIIIPIRSLNALYSSTRNDNRLVRFLKKALGLFSNFDLWR